MQRMPHWRGATVLTPEAQSAIATGQRITNITPRHACPSFLLTSTAAHGILHKLMFLHPASALHQAGCTLFSVLLYVLHSPCHVLKCSPRAFHHVDIILKYHSVSFQFFFVFYSYDKHSNQADESGSRVEAHKQCKMTGSNCILSWL
ncbi:hypothetical protein CEXT_15151 [Caerostris extrusa]|uniref:Uncharacterized protein n=1 Tax=Caerostris extrusa TaxID=172846 RepID=A0AAV4MD04_CAEEX|nr:hypothetical protein CEXT_15151 [Caerostris extrusa]